jgi:hypothetical protein
MAQYTTVSQLSGLFKEVYGDKIESLVPDAAKLVKLVRFEKQDKELGNKYHQPVIVSDSHGFTYAAPAAGAFALNNHIAMAMQDAQVDGYQLLLRDAIDYEAAAKASGGKKAFAKATELIIKRMVESMTKRLEIECFYGQSASGIGLISACTDPGGGTTCTFTISDATWAAGIWAGLENAELDAYVSTTKQNTNAAVVITSVDVDAKTVAVSGNNTDLVAIYASGSPTAYLVFRGSYGSQMAGLDKIITNTGSLFNIDASAYNLWKAQSFSAGSGQLSLAKILQALSKCVNRGLDEDVSCFVSPQSWADLQSDLSALRVYDSSYKPSQGEAGVEKILFHGQNGKIEVMSHSIVKAGEAFLFPLKRVKRIGAQDVSFKFPGFGDDVFFPLPSNAGYEMRLYTDQAIFSEAPAKMVKVTGIVNSV